MLRYSIVRLARQGRGSSTLSGVGGFSLPASWTSWYPEKGGEFLGNTLAGHNVFIEDIPSRFDAAHARHFSLVEALTITPLFSLSMVHYFSLYCQYVSRVAVLRPMLEELSFKSEVQHQWLIAMQNKSPINAIAWRLGLLTLQIVTFPLWLFLSSAAPQIVHATLRHTNHILYTKYSCISSSSNKTTPSFVSEAAKFCSKMEGFHEQNMRLPTDFGVAVIMLLLILFFTS